MTTTPRPWEPLKPWHARLGIPAMALYLAGNALAALDLPAVPGPVLYLAALLILISIAAPAWQNLHDRGWRLVAGLLGALFIAFIFQGMVWPTVLQALGLPTDNSNTEWVTGLVKASPLVMGLMVVVVGPVVEEVLYRFALFRPLHEVNALLGHLVTALCFGLQHIAVAVFVNHNTAEWWQLPSYLVFSLVMSVLYARTRTLWAPILVHVALNGIGFAFMMLG